MPTNEELPYPTGQAEPQTERVICPRCKVLLKPHVLEQHLASRCPKRNSSIEHVEASKKTGLFGEYEREQEAKSFYTPLKPRAIRVIGSRPSYEVQSPISKFTACPMCGEHMKISSRHTCPDHRYVHDMQGLGLEGADFVNNLEQLLMDKPNQTASELSQRLGRDYGCYIGVTTVNSVLYSFKGRRFLKNSNTDASRWPPVWCCLRR